MDIIPVRSSTAINIKSVHLTIPKMLQCPAIPHHRPAQFKASQNSIYSVIQLKEEAGNSGTIAPKLYTFFFVLDWFIGALQFCPATRFCNLNSSCDEAKSGEKHATFIPMGKYCNATSMEVSQNFLAHLCSSSPICNASFLHDAIGWNHRWHQYNQPNASTRVHF